jgi:hypothetical protein
VSGDTNKIRDRTTFGVTTQTQMPRMRLFPIFIVAASSFWSCPMARLNVKEGDFNWIDQFTVSFSSAHTQE